ncbi:MAG TPA: hypothetical protein GX498_05715, partial [Clostridiales bacterium]|nr:hypothetical protein [Clostridiales bacterium]
MDNNGFYGFPQDFKPRRRRGNGLAYFAVGLLGAIIGGFIMALIAPMYIYNKYLPITDNIGSNVAQQIVINPTEDINVAGAVAKKVMPT